MITEKAPGKLYIAGEYAVLEQDCPAILVALDQYVVVSIKPSSSDTGLIHSKQYSQDSIHWVRRGSKIVIDNRDNPFEYILSAISFTERYCLEQKVKMDVYDLFVNSDLDSADGKKYGLGSSAAVTVATVKAILRFYGVQASKDDLQALHNFSLLSPRQRQRRRYRGQRLRRLDRLPDLQQALAERRTGKQVPVSGGR